MIVTKSLSSGASVELAQSPDLLTADGRFYRVEEITTTEAAALLGGKAQPPTSIDAALARLGLGVQQLADELGVSRQTVWGYRKGGIPKMAQLAIEALLVRHSSPR